MLVRKCFWAGQSRQTCHHNSCGFSHFLYLGSWSCLWPGARALVVTVARSVSDGYCPAQIEPGFQTAQGAAGLASNDQICQLVLDWVQEHWGHDGVTGTADGAQPKAKRRVP